MERTFTAVYEHGVFRPLEPANFSEQQRVTLVVSTAPSPPESEDWLDIECLEECTAEVDGGISIEEVRAALAKIPGSLTADFIAERDERF